MSASPSAAANVYELSPMQQGMLFHALHAPESGTSFNQMSCRITGPLEPASFQAAWQRLIDRHDVLRTSFHWQEHAKPMQAVQPHAQLPWVQEDWRRIPAVEQRTRWHTFLAQDRAAGFALGRAPLLRCRLVLLAEHEYFFCWSHHHLLSDGWCLNIVMEEVFQVYGHLTQHAPLALPAVRPYRDYIEWLRRQNSDAARQYWSRYLKGFHTPTPMQARAEFGGRTGATEQLQTELSGQVSQRLREFAAQRGLTLSTLVQGAWALLLARYTNETDIVFGTTVSGRPAELPGVERMLGNFISTVPVRVHADPRQALVPWLKMIQARMAARGPFEHTPLPEIQRCSEIPLPASLFESNVIFMNYPLDANLARGAHGLVLDEVSLYDRADVPVELQVTALERWRIELAFDPQRFERTTLQRMLGHVATLLEAFPGHATEPLGKLSLLSAAERRQIVEEFNDTDVAFDATRTIVHHLEQVAVRTPERIVVECNNVSLTAQELNVRANRLARRLLQAVHLKANDVVAICAHRSERMMVAILAAWKCGAAYLPIDPDYPAQRIQTILDDARATLIVAAAGTLDASLQLSAPVVRLDALEDAQTVADDANPGIPVSGESLAYVIYTSGSTGKPKGAMIEHAGMLNHMLAEADELAIGPASALAQSASHCFDISVWQFFTAPLMGGKTVILDNDVVREPARFLERVAASHVCILELVPSYLTLLLELPAAQRAVLGQLQVILITGEMITPALLERWFALFPHVPAVNAYGPAEASDDIAQCRLEHAPATAYVPVGRPIRNMRIYITDAQMNLCPIAIPGEICVSGIGVGRGYLNDPPATQAAFLHDPFRPEPGVRLYRTGDTGKFLPDGTLLMLGRKDQQVKIHGHRIELGEVENALSTLPPVSQAAVIDHRDDSGRAALCAYIAFRPGATLSDAEIVSALSAVLPQYMVPRSYVVLEKLPLGSNGKIDRKALPSAKLARPSARGNATPPGTPIEQRLCEIWAEVLRIPAPGIHDNLFALGGDSILSMRIVALAGQAGLKVTTRQIFEHPTVAQLAAVAQITQQTQAEIVESSGPLPLTPVQKRFFLHDKTHQHHYNQAVLLEVPPDLDLTLLARACSHTARVHDALRLRFHGGAAGWTQQVSADLEIPVSAHEVAPAELAALLERLHAGLNLATGPVFRADLIRLAPGNSVRLLLVAHHLIVDAVSWSVLLETLYAAYTHLRAGRSPETPLGITSWTQWTQAIDRWARSGALEKDFPHWQALAQLNAPALPTDRRAPPEANTVASAEELVLELSEAASAALLTSAPRAYDAQINDVLLAGLALTVTDWTGHCGVLLKLESHGREELLPDVDISRTVGWFTGEFPVWLQIAPTHRSPRRAIHTVKTQLRSIPTRGLSYGLLLDELGDAAPWPELSFNYLGQSAQMLSNALEWKQAAEPAGDGRPTLQRREHLLDINCYVSNGRLRVAVEFSRSFHERQTVQQLAESYLQTLESIIAEHRNEPAETYELTPTQQGMLFHSLYDRASDVYLSSLSGRIDGPLDSRLFQLAWRELVQRHAALRTSFHWEGVDQPLQKVHHAVSLPWREEDLSLLPPEAVQVRWQSYLEQDRTGSFTLTHAPVMRLSLCRVGEDCWRFNWTHHHILLDGWSAALLLSEVIAIYDALRNGALPQPAPSPPFRDYVHWLGQQNFAAAEAFWTQQLQGFATPTPLMLGRPEMEGNARPGEHQEETHQLPAHESQHLQTFAQAHRLTLNTVAQGAWSLLLSRYSCETDVLHGTIVSGRPAALGGSDRMIGLFINSLPIRVRVPDGPLIPWLQRLQLDLAQLDEYAWFPLANLQKLAALPAGTPLFETLLIFQNYPFEEIAGGASAGIQVAELQVFDPNNYPLTLVVTPGERWTLRLQYDSGRFDRETIARLLQHFATLIASFPAAGAGSIRKLPMLTAAERHRIVHEWNDTSLPIPAEQTVLDLIEAAARAHPRNVAVRCGATVRTYEEIRSSSDRIALHLLAAADIQPDDRVAVLMPRSDVMVATILAIWKCGAAYVPIDPAYPAARIKSILSAARPKLIVAPASVLANIDSVVPVIDPERCHDDLPGSGPSHRRRVANGLAYVIFTSGSTGQPKGAMLEHTGMLNHVLCMARELQLGPQSVVAQTASHCSDISVWQLFAALVSGGETVIYPDAVVLEPSELIDRLNLDRVCALQLVPSYLAALLAELQRRADPSFPHLRTLVTIGETLQPAAVQAWFRLNPGVRLMNAYGPTEASDSVAHYTMERAPELPAIPIGKAIQNLRLYIVDPDMNLCPVGVKGEICIAGIGVGRGYLFDKQRTQAVFDIDPFQDQAPSRLYHSGDIGCLSADGTVLFFGRRDFQVKIRGYRIELGEIETALTRLEGVRQAVVVARKDAGDALSLCGYATGSGCDPAQLRSMLRERLPSYMVPDYIMILPELPVTPNGKINRAALPPPDALVQVPASATAPANAAEAALVRIFAEVLGRKTIGVEDDFFELGGQSLKAIQILSRIRGELHAGMTVADIFGAPTPRALALKLAGPGAVHDERIPVLPARPWYLASHAQKRIWLASRGAQTHAYNMAGALQIEGPVDADQLARACDRLVERHESMRTVFAMVQGELRQKVLTREACGFQLERLSLHGELEDMLQQEAQQPFNLATGPLFRAKLLQLTPRTHVLAITVHHVIADAWSVGVLTRELLALYAGRDLPPLPIQYRDYAEWHCAWLESSQAQAHRAYWHQKLAPPVPRLELPTDFPRPERLTHTGRSLDLMLTGARLSGLHALARTHQTSLYTVVLSSICVLLHRCTGSEDLVIGGAYAGRDHLQLESQIGVFLNTVVLRVPLQKSMSVAEAIAAVARTSSEAIEHAGYPFDLLLEELKIRTPANRFPLFDIQVDYIPRLAEQPDSRITDLSPADTAAKFDLSLHVTEEADRLQIRFVFNTSLFTADSIEALRTRLVRIQDAFLSDPQIPIGRIPLAAPRSERERTPRASLRLRP